MLLLPLFLDWVEDRLLINLDCLLGGREFSRFNPHLQDVNIIAIAVGYKAVGRYFEVEEK